MMKIIILAAGKDQRLGKLTENNPKCLLSLGDETILERQIRVIKDSGIKENNIFVVAGYYSNKVRNVYSNIIVNKKYKTTDNAYSLGLALVKIDEDVIILDGDLIIDVTFFHEILRVKEKNVIFGSRKRQKIDTTGIIVRENYVSDIGKHLNNVDFSYLNIFKIGRENIPKMTELFLDNEFKKNWYTVPLSRILDLVKFKYIDIKEPIYEINSYHDYIDIKDKFKIDSFKILVTGASGFLGKKLMNILARYYKVYGIQNKSSLGKFQNIDLTNKKELIAYIELKKPNIIIHTAAISSPDICEENKEMCRRINVGVTKSIYDICLEKDIKLVLMSTDYVFDGSKLGEYNSLDSRTPLNYYGFTKKEAEDIVLGSSKNLVIRFPIIYGYNDIGDKKTFLTTVLDALELKQKIILDNSQIRYPVLIDEIAIKIKEYLPLNGIKHLTSNIGVTKYQWAQEIARLFNKDINLIQPSTLIEKRNRPLNVKLSCDLSNDETSNLSDIYEGLNIVKKQLNCAFRIIYKSGPTETVFSKNVAEFRHRLGYELGKQIPLTILDEVDYIVPIPSTGIYYAMGLSEFVKKPYLQALVKTGEYMRTFNISSSELRINKILDKITPIKELLLGKNIMIVDEAIFTGTTIRVICDMLRACEVKSIHIAIPTPLNSKRCNYYVMPDRSILAENETELKEYFKVESIHFLESIIFKQQMKFINNDMCYKCFTV